MRMACSIGLLLLASLAQAASPAWRDLPSPRGKKDVELSALCKSGGALFFGGQTRGRGNPGIFLSRAGAKGWTKGLGHGQIQAMSADGQGGVLVAGRRLPPKGYLAKPFIGRYDATGRQRWFVQPEAEVSGDLARLRVHDGRILAVGVHNTRKSGESQGWLLKLDMQGKILDEKRVGAEHYHYLQALVRVKGGWLAGGAGKRAGSYHDWLLSYGENGLVKEGNLRRSRSFDGLHQACPDGIGGAYFLGLSSRKQGHMRSVGQVTVTRVTAAGKTRWRRALGASLAGVFTPSLQVDRLAFVAPEIDQAKGTGRLWLYTLNGKGQGLAKRKIPAPAIMLNHSTPGAFLLGGDADKAELLLVDRKRGGGLRWRRLLLPWP